MNFKNLLAAGLSSVALLGSSVALATPTGIAAIAASYDFTAVESAMVTIATAVAVLIVVVIGWRFLKRMS